MVQVYGDIESKNINLKKSGVFFNHSSVSVSLRAAADDDVVTIVTGSWFAVAIAVDAVVVGTYLYLCFYAYYEHWACT